MLPRWSNFDPAREAERIEEFIRRTIGTTLRRRGGVVAMSGGVDSSVCACLVARALAPQNTLGLALPERDSDPEGKKLAIRLADSLGIEIIVEDISGTLRESGCYARRDDAIRRLVPEFGDGWRCKIVLADAETATAVNHYVLVVESPAGIRQRVRLPAAEYRQIVAATNFKQRVRKMHEYYHADRMHYAVIGTPNKLEHDQGFFVKGGDGLADIKPIAHLYKSQVYALAEFLEVPREVTSRPPTTGTYSLPQTQQEFYFLVSSETLDAVHSLYEAGNSVSVITERTGVPDDRVRRIIADIEQKRETTKYLHLPPCLIDSDEGSA